MQVVQTAGAAHGGQEALGAELRIHERRHAPALDERDAVI
jgi:hypothetical protein